jgi:hypothetical protein
MGGVMANNSGSSFPNGQLGYIAPRPGSPYGSIIPLAPVQAGPQMGGGNMGATAIPGNLAPVQGYGSGGAPAPIASGPLDWFHNWLNQPDTIASMQAALRLGRNTQELGDKAAMISGTGALAGAARANRISSASNWWKIA